MNRRMPKACPTIAPLTWRLPVLMCVLGFVARAPAANYTWNAAAGGNASQTNHWLRDGMPTTSLPGMHDHILLDATSAQNMTWDAGVNGLTDIVGSWTQSTDFTGTVTFDTYYPGQGGFTVFTVTGSCAVEGGVWTQVANPQGSETAVRRLRVDIQGDVTLGAQASILADGLGFSGYRGPGKPAGTGWSPHGAAHGGHGALMGGEGASGAIYGSVHYPETLGSGGGRGDIPAARGGGAIILSVGGSALINGLISANGVHAGDTHGAGGSVNLAAATVSGGGTLRANGAATSYAGSGGGRIAIVLTQSGADFSGFTGTLSAYGGSLSTASGAAGTVYRQTGDQAAGQGTLLIDNANRAPYLSGIATVMPAGVDLNAFAGITITNRGTLGVVATDTLDFGLGHIEVAGSNVSYITLMSVAGVTFPDVFTISNYTLVANTPITATGNWTVASNGLLTHGENYRTEETYKLDLALDGDLTVDGAINVNRRGFRGGYGPGRPTHSYGGSSHGGIGGYSSGATLAHCGPTYGSILEPVNVGSGGGRGDTPTSAGGGAIILRVSGHLALNGAIRADAERTGDTVGSGGSINLALGTLGGAGAITANSGSLYQGGGGGRVAVRLTDTDADFDAFTGTITAYGGAHATQPGAAGTVYLQAATDPEGAGRVIVDHTHSGATWTELPARLNPDEDLKASRWYVSGRGKVGLWTNVLIGYLTVTGTHARVDLRGRTLSVLPDLDINGAFYGVGSYTADFLGATIEDSVGGGFIVVRPVVDNAAGATAVTATSVTLNGNLYVADPSRSLSVLWGPWDAGTNLDEWAYTNTWPTPLAAGAFSTNVTAPDVQANTVYYYRFYTVNSNIAMIAATSSVFMTSEITVQATADAHEQGLIPGTFRFYRHPSATNGAVTVTYTVGGTSLPGKNHVDDLGVSITFDEGSSQTDLTVTPIRDDTSSSNESIIVTLTGWTYILGTPHTATGWVVNAPLPGAPVNVWLGSGSASDPANWSLNHPPTATEHVLLSGYSTSNLMWNLTNAILSWTQTDQYTGTVTVDTVYPGQGAFTELTIHGHAVVEGGVWTQVANPQGSETAVRRLRVGVGGNFTLGAQASILADGLGFSGYRGPGKPAGTGWSPHGAAHGGHGALMGGEGASGAIYGSVHYPETLGSGGGRGDTPAARGGGAIILSVGGSALIDGLISANGLHAGDTHGSGGSVNLAAATVSGNGILRANGAATAYAGSGGGRIAIVLTRPGADFSGFTGTLIAHGGNLSTASGAAGTVYRQTGDQAAGQGTLLIDNAHRAPYLSGIATVMPAGVDLNDFASIAITNRGTLGVVATDTLDFGLGHIEVAGSNVSYITLMSVAGVMFPDVFTISNYTLVANTPITATGNWTVASNGLLTHGENYRTAETYKLDLALDGDLTVDGAINVNRRGFRGGYGPGRPTHSYGGSSHGGIGGYSSGATLAHCGPTYGSILEPVNVGSGGGRGDTPTSAGGGAIILRVSGHLALNGAIRADAERTGDTVGSGGSIHLALGTLGGNGTIAANSQSSYQGGGGGRVAVRLTDTDADFDAFTGTITAYGGAHATQPGAPGTVCLEAPGGHPRSRVLIVNYPGANPQAGVVTDLKNARELVHTTLYVTDGAPVALRQNIYVGDFYMTADAVFDLNFHTLFICSLWHPIAGVPIQFGRLRWLQPSVIQVR